jgi:hypothetical protein
MDSAITTSPYGNNRSRRNIAVPVEVSIASWLEQIRQKPAMRSVSLLWGGEQTLELRRVEAFSQFSMLKGSFHYAHYQSELDSRSDNSSFFLYRKRRIFGCA